MSTKAKFVAVLLVFVSVVCCSSIDAAAPDYTFQIPKGAKSGKFIVKADQAGQATIMVKGLSLGGYVRVTVNGEEPSALELLCHTILEQGKADSALITASLKAGANRLLVAENEGAQVVRIAGTNHWFGTATEAKGHPMFSIDLDKFMAKDYTTRNFPVVAYYGLNWQPFAWLNGMWRFPIAHGVHDQHRPAAINVSGTTGPLKATLNYTREHKPRNLYMPTKLTLERKPGTGCYLLRRNHILRATGEPDFGKYFGEFLHVIINYSYGLDWLDESPDFLWYREQQMGATDTTLGNRTHFERMDDNLSRRYRHAGRASAPNAKKFPPTHGAGLTASFNAVNTIGGWFTKTGVGCMGLIFHKYNATWRSDLSALHGHCGDGADTHIMLFHRGFPDSLKLGMKAGGEIEIEYTLTMLPSEVVHTDLYDLNENDLIYFGNEKEQKSQIVGWIGTKKAIGLERSDGSIILLGIGTKPGRVKVPAKSVKNAKKVYRMFDTALPKYQMLKIENDTVEVQPRWITIIDCGSALCGPDKK